MTTTSALALVLLLGAGACGGEDELPIDAGVPDASEEHAIFPTFCDAMTAFIERDCQWEADCGVIDTNEVPACVDFYLAVLWWRCGDQPPPKNDVLYVACLSDFDNLECGIDAVPISCEGIW